MALSTAAQWVWQIAADEARQASSSCIESSHLFIAACSLEKMDARDPRFADCTYERETITELLADAGLVARSVRQRLRNPSPQTPAPQPAGKISRSPACRASFARADALAGATQALATNVLHLLGALLEDDAGLVSALTAAGAKVATLRTAVFARIDQGPVLNPLGRTGEFAQLARSAIFQPMDSHTIVGLATAHEEPRLAALYAVAALCASETGLESLFTNVLQHVVRSLPAATRAAIFLAEGAGEVRGKASYPTGSPFVSEHMARAAIQRREAFLWRSDDGVTRSDSGRNVEKGIYAPILWKEQALGALCVESADRAALNEPDLRFIVAISNCLAPVAANYALQERLERLASAP